MNTATSSSVPRRLRIAYIVGAFPSPSETFVVNQIVGMVERGHEVDVFSTSDGVTARPSAALEQSGLKQRVYRLHPSSHRVVAAARTLWMALTVGWQAASVIRGVAGEIQRRGLAGSGRLLYVALTLTRRGRPRYDVIHGQFGEYGVLASQLVRIGAMQGAVVTSFRGYDVGKYLLAHPDSYKELFREGHLFLPVSRTLAERLMQAGCDPARIRVHPSGIACRELEYREVRAVQGNVRLITVARLVEKKGITFGILAVKRLLAAGKRVSYEIVGDGPLHAELESLIAQLQIDRHVRLVGLRVHDEVLAMIRDAHILVAPSVTSEDGDVEGIPNVLKEAMASGLPVVATRHGGIPELVDDTVAGFLVPERDDQALADRLLQLIEHQELWQSMGRAGRAKVEAEFDIERLTVELEQIYVSLQSVLRQEATFDISHLNPRLPAA